MDSAWQLKCASALASSSSSVASSIQVPSQMSQNQVQTNNAYGIQLHDARQPCFPAFVMNHVSPFSSTPGLGPCTNRPELGNSFQSLPSRPPSQLQGDFQHFSNIGVLNSSYPANFSTADLTTSIFTHSHRLTHDPRDSNSGSGVDTCPMLSHKGLASSQRSLALSSDGDVDIIRPFVSYAVSGHVDPQCVYFREEVYMGSSNAYSDRMTHGSNSGTLEKSPPGLSSSHQTQPSTLVTSSRVLCMDRSGELLVSGEGLLAVVCSCHGLRMSVANFCEHSGLTNVIPGYAVHMDTGETIAEWRKTYFFKSGVRIPEDNRGWEWPESLFSSVGVPGFASTSGGVKDSGRPYMVCTPFEPVYGRHLNNNLFAGFPHPAHKQAAGVLQNGQPGKSYDQPIISKAGFLVRSERNLHDMADGSVKTFKDTNNDSVFKAHNQGGVFSRGQLTSHCCNAVSQVGTSFAQGFQHLRGPIVKAHNENIGVARERPATASSIELNLGQPSEKFRSSEPCVYSAIPSCINDPMKVMSQEESTHRIAAPHGTNYQFYSGSSSTNGKGKHLQIKSSKHAFADNITNNAGNRQTVNTDLPSNSRMSMLHSHLASSAGAMSIGGSDKPKNHNHHITPSIHHFQNLKSGHKIADGATRLSNADKLAFATEINKSSTTRNSTSTSLEGSETSFTIYAKHMEKMGFFSRYDPGSNRSSPVDVKKCNLFQSLGVVPNILGTSRPPEGSVEKSCTVNACVEHSALKKIRSSVACGATSQSQEFSTVVPLEMANLAQNSRYAVSNKNKACDDPSQLGGSLTRLAFAEPSAQDQRNGSILSNEHQKLQIGGSDVERRGSLIDLLSSEGRNERHDLSSKSSVPESNLKFSPAFACLVDGDVRNGPFTSGSKIKNITAHRSGFSLYSEELNKHSHVSRNILPGDHPLRGAGNKAASHDTCGRCSERDHKMGSCNCVGYMSCSIKENEFKEAGSICGLMRSSLTSEAYRIHGTGISKNCIQAEKTNSLEDGKLTRLIDEDLKSSISQWKDVPAKEKADHKLISLTEPADGIEKRVKSGAEFKSHGAENDLTSDRTDDKFKEFSNVSSGCSCTAREASDDNEVVSSTDECAHRCHHAGYKKSVFENCLSSDDATVSQKSSEYLSSAGMTKSIRDHLPKSLCNPDPHDFMPDRGRCNALRVGEVQGRALSSVKRKRRTKLTLNTSFATSFFSSSPAEPHSDRGDAAIQHYPLAEDDHEPPKSLKDSFDPCYALSRGFSSEQREIPLLQRCSRKRDLDAVYGTEMVENNSEKQVEDRLLCDSLQDTVVVENSRQADSIEATNNHRLHKVNFKNPAAVLKFSWVGCTEAKHGRNDHSQSSKVKPVVCGMYGIILGKENFLRLPKIVSLSEVLKSAKKCDDKPQLTSLRGSKKGGLRSRLYGFGKGRDSSRRWLQRNRGGRRISSTAQISSDAELNHHFDGSVSDGNGHDQPKVNVSISNVRTFTQFKPKFKAARRRSLYELLMAGEISSKNLDGSKDKGFVSQEQCRSEMKASASMEKSYQQLDDSSGNNSERITELKIQPHLPVIDSSCCVCGRSNEDQTNCVLECRRCSIRIHQACYGISRVPKGPWCCRPCSANAVDTVCVLCGYGGGAMTRASRCYNAVKSLLRAWNIPTKSGARNSFAFSERFDSGYQLSFPDSSSFTTTEALVHNSVTAGFFDPIVKQWIHMVCALWTPGTCCTNADTMNSFDVSGVPHSKQNTVCVICQRPGGSCIRCQIRTCSSHFHPWCAHLKGLLQSETEGVNNEKISFYGRCMLHAMSLSWQAEACLDTSRGKEATCARTEGYKGRKQDVERYNTSSASKGSGRCLVPQEQLNAWIHINKRNLSLKTPFSSSVLDVEHDYKKEYARYKKMKGHKQLVVYKSAIHALGLYTSQLIPHGAMVVEYVGEIVGARVADKREIEYGRKLLCKSACYFFRIDKEHIIDATRKGGIARFVNHSCTPNCVAKIISVRNEKKVVFFAQRDIYPGEEITYDYHFNEDEDKKIPCLCKSRNCRRYLN